MTQRNQTVHGGGRGLKWGWGQELREMEDKVSPALHQIWSLDRTWQQKKDYLEEEKGQSRGGCVWRKSGGKYDQGKWCLWNVIRKPVSLYSGYKDLLCFWHQVSCVCLIFSFATYLHVSYHIFLKLIFHLKRYFIICSCISRLLCV